MTWRRVGLVLAVSIVVGFVLGLAVSEIIIRGTR